MSITVQCPGCARQIALADGDARAQVRCPACGFSFDRPAARSDAITAEPPPPPRASRAIRAGRPDRGAAVVRCDHCGEPLRAKASRDDEPVRCPVCGNTVARRSRQITAKAPPVKAASTQITTTSPGPRPTEDDEGAEAYRFAHVPRSCPRCDRELDDRAVLCLGCGFNSETGVQAVREFAPVERTWDGGLSYRSRLVLFGAGQVIAVGMVGGAILGDFLLAGLVTWLVGTVLLAYTVGTFSRLAVARSHTGHVKVTKAWHVCFVPLRPERINLRMYEGVTTGMTHGADLWDWIVLIILLGYGLIPGLIWWYWAFHRDTFYAGLTQNHGMLTLDLYRGWDEAAMKEVAHVVRDVGGYLPQ